jgi:hypothetical protein
VDWWMLTTANAAGTNGLTCLSKRGGARYNDFGHPSNDRPTLLKFRDRTLKRTDGGAIELLVLAHRPPNWESHLKDAIFWTKIILPCGFHHCAKNANTSFVFCISLMC